MQEVRSTLSIALGNHKVQPSGFPMLLECSPNFPSIKDQTTVYCMETSLAFHLKKFVGEKSQESDAHVERDSLWGLKSQPPDRRWLYSLFMLKLSR